MTFYEALPTVIMSMPNDKLIILGDFNAHVDRNFEICNVLGCYDIGKVNANGLKRHEFYSGQFDKTICNTLYKQKLIELLGPTQDKSMAIW